MSIIMGQQFCDWFSDTPQDDIRNLTTFEIGVNHKLYSKQCIGDRTTFYDFLLLGIGMSIVSILGVFGNAMSALVLLKSQFRSSVNFLLLGLTLSDTIVILYCFATFALPNTFGYLNFAKYYNYNLFPLISPYLLPIAFIGQTGSVYFCVAVTVERYVVVCWPLYAKSWCTNRRARSYTLIVFLFSILINFPKWFEIEALQVEIFDKNLSSTKLNVTVNRTCLLVSPTPLRTNNFYKHYYVNWTYLIFMYAIPFLVLVTLNYAIYKRVIHFLPNDQPIKTADRRRSTLTTKGESRETSVAKMLLCVVIVFLACNFLAMFNNVLETLWEFNCNTLVNLANFFVLFNSCCNFAIYYIFGQKFRTCFIATWNELCPCLQLKVKLPRNNFSCRSIRTETIELVQSPSHPTLETRRSLSARNHY